MNIENVLSELEDQGLTDDEIGLVEEVTIEIKIEWAK